MKPSDWDKIIQVNLYGTVHVNRACIPHFLKNDRAPVSKQRGVIVNLASTAALGRHPWMAAYAASKGGVISWTRSIFMEYVRRGIRANSVVAGGIATKLHQDFVMPEGGDARLLQGAMPMVDFGTPEEAAGTVVFLASDEARYINGTEVRIDGGALS
jgi:NAD(P)-dependent dehydrogenase (short-subunit alcohol dehydrogenase family)